MPGIGEEPGRADVLVLGSAACLWADLACLPSGFITRSQVIAANWSAVAYLGRVDFWVSLHPDLLPGWIGRRCAQGGPDGFLTVAPIRPARVPVALVFPERWGGSSGLYAVQFALERLGAARVVLAGVPVDDQSYLHGAEPRFAVGAKLERYRDAWRRRAPSLRGKVTSLGGWSRELLGGPLV